MKTCNFEDFCVLNLMGTFILRGKLAKNAKKINWGLFYVFVKAITMEKRQFNNPLLGGGGLENGLKRPFSNFKTIFYQFSKFTAQNKCAYQIQHTKIFKIANFQPSLISWPLFCCAVLVMIVHLSWIFWLSHQQKICNIWTVLN